jgi:hypothetical protein
MSYRTSSTINNLLNVLLGKINNLINTSVTNPASGDFDMNNFNILNVTDINGLPYPPTGPSLTLEDVLINGNSAGSTNIDMSGNDITNIDTLSSAGYLTLSAPDIFTNCQGLQFDAGSYINLNSNSGNIDIIAQTDDINLQSVTGMSLVVNNGALNITTSGAGISLNTDSDINITSTDNINLTSTADAINLNANLDITLTAVQGFINITSTNDEISLTSSGTTSITSNTGNIELISINNGTTELGIVRVNKNNSLLGDGFLTAGTIDISSDELGYNITPQLSITNLNATAGITNGVPSVSFYKNGRNAGNNDRIGDFFFNANDTTSTNREWARMEVVTRNVTVGNEDGSISFFASLNGVSTEFLRINGADGDNNFLRPLDMNGSAIFSTSGSLSISASGSSGAGAITLTPKPLGNLIFQNLPTSSVGLPSGAVWNNLGVLNIAP